MFVSNNSNSSVSATTSNDEFDYFPEYSHPYSHTRNRQRQSTPAISSTRSTPNSSYRGSSVHVDREHHSLPPSLENHPFCRGLSSISGSAMGQVQTKGGVGLEVSPSTGPDPTIFRQHSRFPNVQISNPTNPVTMQSPRDDEIKPRLDHSPPSSATLPTPTGSANSRTFGLPRPGLGGFGSKQKGLARKLSRKGPPAPIVTKKSMGPDPFEARPFSPMPPMEGMEGIKSQQAIVEEYGSRTAKAGTFPIRQGSEIQPQIPPPVTKTQSPFPVTSNVTRAPITPTTPVHRRVSSMTRSPRASIRSTPSKRAEREWRAKVAGLAHTHRGNGGIEARGPVPPRRAIQAQGISDRDRSSSPEEDNLITPNNSVPTVSLLQQQQENTPAKSFASNRSFETLGHYAHLSPTRNTGPATMADPGTRQCSVPQSVVSSFYFDQRASRVSTHLSPLVTSSATLSPIPSSQVSESPIPSHKASLPPFSSFHLSPASVGPPPSPTPSPHASPMVYPTRSEEDMPPLSLSKGISSQSHSRRLHLSAQLPPLSPGPRTPIRQIRPATITSTPGTPYSPTTAHIMGMDHVDLDLSLSYTGDQIPVRGAQRHPYARTPSMLIDSPPRKSRGMPLCPRHEVVSPPCRHVPAFQQDRPRGRNEAKGTAPLRTAKRVDLTPGMENGMRPPKSGLSMTDLERWLASTSIGSR